MSRSNKVSSMQTVYFLRVNNENIFLSSPPPTPPTPLIYHVSYSVDDLNIKYLEHSQAFGPRKEIMVLNIKLVILISRIMYNLVLV